MASMVARISPAFSALDSQMSCMVKIRGGLIRMCCTSLSVLQPPAGKFNQSSSIGHTGEHVGPCSSQAACPALTSTLAQVWASCVSVRIWT